MLKYPEDRQQINEIFRIINSGRFYSLTFMKINGEVRFLNGHKEIYNPPNGKPKEIVAARPNKLEQNLLLVWDRNAIDRKTGKRGAYRLAKLENLMYVKSGNDVLDFMEENNIIDRFNLSDQQIQNIKEKMKLNNNIQQETFKLFEEIINESEIYTFRDLQEMFKRMGFGEKGSAALNLLMTDEYRKNGDEGVIDFFEKVTGHKLYNFSKGKYSFTPV